MEKETPEKKKREYVMTPARALALERMKEGRKKKLEEVNDHAKIVDPTPVIAPLSPPLAPSALLPAPTKRKKQTKQVIVIDSDSSSDDEHQIIIRRKKKIAEKVIAESPKIAAESPPRVSRLRRIGE